MSLTGAPGNACIIATRMRDDKIAHGEDEIPCKIWPWKGRRRKETWAAVGVQYGALVFSVDNASSIAGRGCL